jgi:hypothetical protein
MSDDITSTIKMQAFKRLDEDRCEISKILPDDFDPDKELEKAREQIIYKEFEGEGSALKHV